MMRTVCITVLFLASVSISHAQIFSIGEEQKDSTAQGGIEKDEPEDKETWKDRFYLGANIGAQFGASTFVDLSPSLGFKLTDRISVGTQLTYQYLNLQAFNYQTHITGISAFTRVFIFSEFYVHTEYGIINGNFDAIDDKRETLQNWLIGGGYRYHIKGKLGIIGQTSLNLLQSNLHPFRNPMINVGIVYGL